MRASENRRAGGRGFTLIELLVAITILAVVAVLGWRGLDSIVRSRLALTEELADTRGMQIGFAQLQSDCAQLATPAATGNRVAIDVAPDRLLLVRTVYADGQAGRLHVISYRLADGVLSRQQSAGTRSLDQLDLLWQAARNDALDTPALPLLHGLAAMRFRLWDAAGSGWRGTDAAAAPGQASSGLEVSLTPAGRTLALVKIMLLGSAG